MPIVDVSRQSESSGIGVDCHPHGDTPPIAVDETSGAAALESTTLVSLVSSGYVADYGARPDAVVIDATILDIDHHDATGFQPELGTCQFFAR